MVIGSKGAKRKAIVEKIKIINEGGKDQEVIVCHKAVPPQKANSVWSWHEEFAAAWSQTFITKKRNPER